MVREFPEWQVVLFDLRGHGESPSFKPPHTLFHSAHDIHITLDTLNITPNLVIGHSFGGKVSLAMIIEREKQYIENKTQTWIIDSIPMLCKNTVQFNTENTVESVLNVLKEMPKEFDQKKFVIKYLKERGISDMIASWMTTNVMYILYYILLLELMIKLENIK